MATFWLHTASLLPAMRSTGHVWSYKHDALLWLVVFQQLFLVGSSCRHFNFVNEFLLREKTFMPFSLQLVIILLICISFNFCHSGETTCFGTEYVMSLWRFNSWRLAKPFLFCENLLCPALTRNICRGAIISQLAKAIQDCGGSPLQVVTGLGNSCHQRASWLRVVFFFVFVFLLCFLSLFGSLFSLHYFNNFAIVAPFFTR